MKLSILLCLAAASLGLAGCGEVVDAGNRGVKITNGRVSPESLKEGFYFYNPLTTSIKEQNARSSKYSADVQSTTKDLQIVTVKFNLGYRPNGDKIPQLYQDRGEEWANQLVPPAVTSILKGALSGYRAPDVVANQGRIQYQVGDQIRRRLAKLGIATESFDILNIAFSNDYANAIEAKEVAVQRAQAAINQTAVIREQGNQKVIAAEASAKAIQLESEALKSSPTYVAKIYAERWDGKMPSTVYCSSSTPCVGAPGGN